MGVMGNKSCTCKSQLSIIERHGLPHALRKCLNMGRIIIWVSCCGIHMHETDDHLLSWDFNLLLQML